MKRRTVLGLGLAAAMTGMGGAATARNYTRDLSRANARITHGSLIAKCRFGNIEYATAGVGKPVLMIHGTGGGFDQGLAFAEHLINAGYQVIAPSRFGYLRSTFPDEPSSENQSDAFCRLARRTCDRARRGDRRFGRRTIGDAIRDSSSGSLQRPAAAGAGYLCAAASADNAALAACNRHIGAWA